MKMNPYVFFTSSGIAILFVVLGAVFSEPMGRMFASVQDFIVGTFGWFYIVAAAFFLLFVLWLLVSPYGRVRLGKDDEEPEYSYLTWFAMLFSAGMGIGLVFYGVAEPVLHFGNPPRSEPQTVEAAREAINLTFFHWGLHAWAIYIVVGLSLAYFAYRHDLPLTLRSTLYPLLGKHVHGPVGNVVAILAVFGTMFGLATSLGLGVMQINAGLDYLGLMSISTTNQVIVIVVITLLATVSVATGVDVGIRRLSELNLVLALLLLLFVFIVGPTVFLLSSFVQSVGNYASSLVQMTFRTDAFIGVEWQKSWTMFYWGWWISWSPFVGMFIARVSRGRTVREFILGVLFVPTILTFFWMVVFGDTAIHMELFGEGGMVEAVNENISTAVFVMLERLPLSAVSATITTVVVAVFFITSSDSGSLVIDILTSGGHPDPPIGQRVFWALAEGAIAAILLVTGGLLALQTAAITTALPFSVIMLVICWSLVKGLRAERVTFDPIGQLREVGHRVTSTARRLTPGAPPAGATPNRAYTGSTSELPEDTFDTEIDWRQRLKTIIDARSTQAQIPRKMKETARQRTKRFIRETIVPAFEQIKTELETHGRHVTIARHDTHARLVVEYRGEEEFTYAVKARMRSHMGFAYPEFTPQHEPRDIRAEIVLRSGKKAEHTLEAFTVQGIIDDFLASYAKWMDW